jgi:lipooligosaccharide transport system permease protein
MAIDVVRPLFMGQLPATPWGRIAMLVAYTVVAFWIALALIRKRFRA